MCKLVKLGKIAVRKLCICTLEETSIGVSINKVTWKGVMINLVWGSIKHR